MKSFLGRTGQGPAFSRPSHLLDRTVSERPSAALTSLQRQVDGLVDSFVSQASDWKSLAALTAGGMAYRFGRIGLQAPGHGLSRLLSAVAGLSAEVSAFEVANRALAGAGFPWRWSGPGGLKQGFLSSLISFGSLKMGGRWAPGQNLVLQHGIQDLHMVAGHQLAYRVGAGEKPEGNFAEQLLRAETTNWQIKAGLALSHRLTLGKLTALERGLDRSIRSSENAISPQPVHPFAFAGGSMGPGVTHWLPKLEKPKSADRLDVLSESGSGEKENSPIVKKQKWVRIDRARFQGAFVQAMQEAEQTGKTVTPRRIALRAYGLYVEGLPKNERPHWKMFMHSATGARKHPEIAALLEKSPIVKRRDKVEIDPARLLKSFERPIKEAEEKGESVTPQQIADRAHAIYIQELPNDKRPSRDTFRNYVRAPQRNPEIFALLRQSRAVRKQKQVKIETPRLRRAFEQALQEAKEKEGTVSFQEIADRAHAIYIQELPNDKRPSRDTFRNRAKSPIRDPKTHALLVQSGVVKKGDRD